MIALRDALLLTFLVLLVFGGSLGAPFLLDDFYLVNHPSLSSPAGWKECFRLTETRPLVWLSYWLNYQLAGSSPFWFHAVNLGLHLLCVLLLRLLLSLLLTRPEALLAAAIFAIHPLQTQAVAWVSARPVLLAAAFGLAAFWLWLRRHHWAAVALFALALLSKEDSVALPLVLLLYSLLVTRDTAGRTPLAAMFVLSLFAGVRSAWATAVVQGSGAGAQAGVSPLDYFLSQSVAIWRYVRLVLFPWGFSFDPEIAQPPLWLALLLWLALVAAAVLLWRRAHRRGASFYLLAAFILLLPSSSLLPAADLAADRRMYLPMLGVAAAAASLLPASRLWASSLYVAFLAFLSLGQVHLWRNPELLWREAVRLAPHKLRPRIQLARFLPPKDAIPVLLEAKQLAPDSELVASELGRYYLLTGQARLALPEFGRALALNPGNPNALNNRGLALLALKQIDAAKQDFQRALALDACHFNARYNLLQCGIPTQPPPHCRFTEAQHRLLRGSPP